MCEILSAALMMGATGAQALIGASQQAEQASLQKGNALYQAALARNAALASEYQAQDAEQRAAAEEESRRRKTALSIGTQQARFAAQGSDLMGSPLDILGDTAAAGELEALSLRYQGQREAWLQRLQATNSLAKANELDFTASRVNPNPGIEKSLLGGFSGMVDIGRRVDWSKLGN